MVSVSGLVMAVLLGSSVPAPAPLPSVKLPAVLQKVLTDYETAWRAKDAAALAALFTEDGMVLPSFRPPVRGRGPILAYYSGQGGPLVLRAFAYAVEGDVGYILGGYSRAVGEPDMGKFTLTLRKDGTGRWFIVSDMDNGNQPPRTPQPSPAPAPEVSTPVPPTPPS